MKTCSVKWLNIPVRAHILSAHETYKRSWRRDSACDSQANEGQADRTLLCLRIAILVATEPVCFYINNRRTNTNQVGRERAALCGGTLHNLWQHSFSQLEHFGATAFAYAVALSVTVFVAIGKPLNKSKPLSVGFPFRVGGNPRRRIVWNLESNWKAQLSQQQPFRLRLPFRMTSELVPTL